jgi:histidine triad (HIT) family protein
MVDRSTHSAAQPGCPFCPPRVTGEVILSDDVCFAMWTRELPKSSAMILPIAHRKTPFDLTDAEWRSTKSLLVEMQRLIQQSASPDGWNIGWNVEPVGGQAIPHAHCHLIPRYRSELYAGRGIRWWFKQPRNQRGAQ